jgi:KDO II ethanolaminephosphotransferase
MNELVNKLKDSNAIIFYASDHGESLGEGDVFLHGAPLETAPREQRRVPMIIWMSDKFIKSNQKNYANLKKANELNRAEKLEVKHDHFFHTIIGCLGIKPTKKIENSDLNLCNISATK